jgi:hypothetical protein
MDKTRLEDLGVINYRSQRVAKEICKTHWIVLGNRPKIKVTPEKDSGGVYVWKWDLSKGLSADWQRLKKSSKVYKKIQGLNRKTARPSSSFRPTRTGAPGGFKSQAIPALGSSGDACKGRRRSSRGIGSAHRARRWRESVGFRRGAAPAVVLGATSPHGDGGAPVPLRPREEAEEVRLGVAVHLTLFVFLRSGSTLVNQRGPAVLPLGSAAARLKAACCTGAARCPGVGARGLGPGLYKEGGGRPLLGAHAKAGGGGLPWCPRFPRSGSGWPGPDGPWRVRTMCGSRTGGWSLPCVMSDWQRCVD